MGMAMARSVVMVMMAIGAASGDPRTRYGSSRRQSSQAVVYPADDFDKSNKMEGVSLTK